MNMRFMSLWRPTHSRYAHQRAVATFNDLIIYFNEWSLTLLTQALSYSAIIAGVRYEVHRFITTGLLPDEEWSEE